MIFSNRFSGFVTIFGFITFFLYLLLVTNNRRRFFFPTFLLTTSKKQKGPSYDPFVIDGYVVII